MKLDGKTPIHEAAEYLLDRVLAGRNSGVPIVSSTIKSLTDVVKVDRGQ